MSVVFLFVDGLPDVAPIMFSFVAVLCLVGVHLGVCHALLGRSPRRTICVTCEDVIFLEKT